LKVEKWRRHIINKLAFERDYPATYRKMQGSKICDLSVPKLWNQPKSVKIFNTYFLVFLLSNFRKNGSLKLGPSYY